MNHSETLLKNNHTKRQFSDVSIPITQYAEALIFETHSIIEQLKTATQVIKRQQEPKDKTHDSIETLEKKLEEELTIIMKTIDSRSKHINKNSNLEIQKMLHAYLTKSLVEIQSQIEMDRSTMLIDQLAITTVSTLVISGALASYKPIDFETLPIIISGILYTNPKLVQKLTNKYLPCTEAIRVKNLISIIPVGFLAMNTKQPLQNNRRQFSGSYKLSNLNQEETIEIGLRKIFGKELNNSILGILTRSLGMVFNYAI